MDKFAFIVHPTEVRQLYHLWPKLRWVPQKLLKKMLEFTPTFKLSHITGVCSINGKEIEGYFILYPLLTEQILSLDEQFVIKKIITAGKIAERIGAKMLGLGALTGVIKDEGRTVAQSLNIPITNGSSYAASVIIDIILKAVEFMTVQLINSKVAIIGAACPIGSACIQILSEKVKQISVTGGNCEKLEKITSMFKTYTYITHTTNIEESIYNADIIILLTGTIIASNVVNLLKKGAIVCDMPAFRSITAEVAKLRNDILFLDGAIVEPPCDINFGVESIGLPKNLLYACMAETILLTLEGKFETYSFGLEPSMKKIEEISKLAFKHGYKAKVLSFGRLVTKEYVTKIRRACRK